MLDLMLSRRTVRKFTEEKVSEEDREAIIKAAMSAPSGRAIYPVELVVCEDARTIAELKNCRSNGTTALNTAPLAIAIIADADRSDVWDEDASISAAYIMLECEKLNLGCCWVQIRGRSNDQGDSGEAVKKLLRIPDNYEVLSVMAIGHKAEFPAGYTEDKIDYAKVHRGRF